MKRFFYASAAVLMLVAAYQLGVRDAAGQARPHIEAVGYDSGQLHAVVNRAWVLYDRHTGTQRLSLPLPAPGPVAGVGNFLVVYQDGSVYEYRDSPGSWELTGNIAGRDNH